MHTDLVTQWLTNPSILAPSTNYGNAIFALQYTIGLCYMQHVSNPNPNPNPMQLALSGVYSIAKLSTQN